MSTRPHPLGCTCEHCWARMTGAAPAEDALPTSRAELLAVLDRAFNAGVEGERHRAAREAEEQRARKR